MYLYLLLRNVNNYLFIVNKTEYMQYMNNMEHKTKTSLSMNKKSLLVFILSLFSVAFLFAVDKSD